MLMKSFNKILISLFIAACLFSADIGYGQFVNPEDEYGSREHRKQGLHDGNLVKTVFYNYGQIGDWNTKRPAEWPKGSGHGYIDGVTPLVLTELVDIHGDTVHSVAAGYYEGLDISPEGEEWAWEPVPGYSNPDQDSPAISDNKNSWPFYWPDKDTSWTGFWNGFFGKRPNADQESYFVMMDNTDKEFDYYPSPSDSSRRGAGLRVEVRGFQWTNILAEDVIFWHYDIQNIAEKDLTRVYFGMYVDNGVGGYDDSLDDNAFYDASGDIDLTYAWDTDNVGHPGNWTPVGYVGYAFLESPGNWKDQIDNDEDGMVDERRDDGIDNDGDWREFEDLNGNGKWDEGEDLRDDLGKDGIGPLDVGYRGPDEGEADGLPTPGEPNFDQTDVDESDQIGLTSVDLFTVQDVFFRDDEEMWNRMQSGHFDTDPVLNTNMAFIYGSGSFSLPVKQKERFSMALLMGSDIDDLFRNEETVQIIYNANYNFARPPIKPIVKAVAGDRKVTLYWDNRAEESRDVFLNYKKDFEGYKIYRSTDPDFNDIRTVTDMFGNPVYMEPLAVFDLVDSIAGPHPVGYNGIHYYMGNNSGLQHSFVDTTVENGRRYYYAVVSYDQGDPTLGATGLLPTECGMKIRVDFNGSVETDVNTVAVTPNAPPVGFKQAGIKNGLQHISGAATGTMDVAIFDPKEVKDGHRYRVTFKDSTILHYTTSYSLVDISGDFPDTLIKDSRAVYYDQFGLPQEGPLFDGMRLVLYNDTSDSFVDSLSGWINNSGNFELELAQELSPPNRRTIYPGTFEIRFFDTIVDTGYLYNNPVKFEVWEVSDPDKPEKWDFIFYGTKPVVQDGDRIVPIFFEGNRYKTTWAFIFHKPDSSEGTPIPPSAGDIARLTATKRFASSDVYEFEVTGASIDAQKAANELSKIAVVPNPYVVAAPWEPKNLLASGRGQRKIDFIHVPNGSKIRIFTLSGKLVRTLTAEHNLYSGAVSWDLKSKDGMDVAFGVYLYHVEAPGIGEYIGKFAIIK